MSASRPSEDINKAAELLFRSVSVGQGDLIQSLTEICSIAAQSLGVTRVNIWEINESFTAITSLLNFDLRSKELLPNATIYRYQCPNYFKLIQSEEIIPTSNALTNSNTLELRDGYLVPNNVLSLIDVPIRIEGKMIGVVCFEDTSHEREWTNADRKFCILVSQMIALALETQNRKKTQTELEKLLSENKALLSEIHKRVRNNFTMVTELINSSLNSCKDEYHRELIRSLMNRVTHLDMLQRKLLQSEKLDKVNVRDLILDLVAGYRINYDVKNVIFSTLLDNFDLSVSKASVCGLLLDECIQDIIRKYKSENRIGVRIEARQTGQLIHIRILVENTILPVPTDIVDFEDISKKFGITTEFSPSPVPSYNFSMSC